MPKPIVEIDVASALLGQFTKLRYSILERVAEWEHHLSLFTQLHQKVRAEGMKRLEAIKDEVEASERNMEFIKVLGAADCYMAALSVLHNANYMFGGFEGFLDGVKLHSEL